MQAKHLMARLCVVVLLTSTQLAKAESEPAATAPTLREINLAKAGQIDARRAQDFGGNPGFLVRPGLLADRTGRIVRVSAESVRLKTGDPVEFPLITRESGKDYESLAVSFASALDLDEALRFIGLRSNHGVDTSQLLFWAKGDRVRMTFHYQTGPTNTPPLSVPAERLVLDTRTSKPLPETGFVFTGSEWLPAIAPATGKVFAADAFSPGSIVSIYNDSTTVMDVPRRATQNDVYTLQVPNPDYLLPSNQLIEITFQPFYPDTLPHYQDLTLHVAPAPGNSSNTDLMYSLKDAQGVTLNTNLTLNGFLAALEKHSSPSLEAFVTLHPDDTLSLSAFQKLARLINSLDNEKGIRVEAPLAGHPYYKAFLPDERFRVRDNRPSIAAELHLTMATGSTTGKLIWIDMEWKGDDATPLYRERSVAVASPGDLENALMVKEEPPAVLLIFAPGSMPYGVFRSYAAPLLKRKMILYVFGE